MKYGVALGRLNPAFFTAVTEAADTIGFESVWLPEHMVFTSAMSRSPIPGEAHPPVPPQTPVFDAFSYLSFLAARTQCVRLGTHVFNIGLRHPFTTTRSVHTLDIISGGRVEFGIGASWLEEEWKAAQLDFATRGARVNECIEIYKRLSVESEVGVGVGFAGTHFNFDAVVFEPKPVQRPWPPILVGGESAAALRRAAQHGDGWIGMGHTAETAAAQIVCLRTLLEQFGRDADAFQYCCGGAVQTRAEADAFAAAGVTRLIVSPWRRSPDAVRGLEEFAAAML